MLRSPRKRWDIGQSPILRTRTTTRGSRSNTCFDATHCLPHTTIWLGLGSGTVHSVERLRLPLDLQRRRQRLRIGRSGAGCAADSARSGVGRVTSGRRATDFHENLRVLRVPCRPDAPSRARSQCRQDPRNNGRRGFGSSPAPASGRSQPPGLQLPVAEASGAGRIGGRAGHADAAWGSADHLADRHRPSVDCGRSPEQ